jgi:nucleotide-binding universal stress UspA family protein
MIKDVMVLLDGGKSDGLRIAAAAELVGRFRARILAVFVNVLPLLVPEEGGAIAGSVVLMNKARAIGDDIESDLAKRLSQSAQPFELRRYDVLSDTKPSIAAREARAADTFVALSPNGSPHEDSDEIVKEVLFGSGRHVFLVPRANGQRRFGHVIVAWNGTRESARALSEAIPYLERAERVTVLVVVVRVSDVEDEILLGSDAVTHLDHHGIKAELQRISEENQDAGATLLAETQRLGGDLIVLGGYGHSRLREWLLGGVTEKLLHESPVPLLVAH